MNLLVLVLLVILIAAGLPQTGWHPYGYWPSGSVTLLLLVIIILLYGGRL